MVNKVLIIAVLATLGPLGMEKSLHGEIVDFTAIPTGACAGTSSTATGVATFHLDTTTGNVAYDISLTGVTPVGMHIHAPATECFLAQIAGVRFAFPPATDVSGDFVADQQLIDWMLAEQSWLVVHSGPQGSVEIIGQLLRDCPNDCSGHGGCLAGHCYCETGWSGDDCSIPTPVPAVSSWGLFAMSLLLLGGATLALRGRYITA